MSCTERPSGKKQSCSEVPGERMSSSSRRSAAAVTADEWAVPVSTVNGFSTNWGGLIEGETGSDSVDGFWNSKTTLVRDCFLCFSSLDDSDGLCGSCG